MWWKSQCSLLVLRLSNPENLDEKNLLYLPSGQTEQMWKDSIWTPGMTFISMQEKTLSHLESSAFCLVLHKLCTNNKKKIRDMMFTALQQLPFPAWIRYWTICIVKMHIHIHINRFLWSTCQLCFGVFLPLHQSHLEISCLTISATYQYHNIPSQPDHLLQ